jgi:hypothetical protein
LAVGPIAKRDFSRSWLNSTTPAPIVRRNVVSTPTIRESTSSRKIMQTCPDCGSDFTRRIARTWWMRVLFKDSKYIHCSRCDQRSLVRGAGSTAVERPLMRVSRARRVI